MRKGQVTIFIIIGLVILLVTAFVFYLVGLVQTNRPILPPEFIDSLDLYLENTFQQFTVNGLILIGEQGGAIYNGNTTLVNARYALMFFDADLDQGGNSIFNPGEFLLRNKTLYPREDEGLSDTVIRPAIVPSPEHQYCHIFSSIRNPECYPDHSSFPDYQYGLTSPDYTLPELRYSLYSAFYDQSITRQLESYIQNHSSRLRFEAFNTTGTHVEFTRKPEVRIMFIPGRILVNISYKIVSTKGNKVSTLEDHHLRINYDLYNLHGFAQTVIRDDLYYLKDIVASSNDDYIVERKESAEKMYDIITVIDDKYKLKGRKYSFSFIRINRPPDANSVFITDEDGGILNSTNKILSTEPFVVHCPNSQTTGSIIDPDEDDRYDPLVYSFELDGSDLPIGCGTSEGQTTILASDYGLTLTTSSGFVVKITDSGNMQDSITFTGFVS